MPSLTVKAQQPSPVSPQVEMPPEFPDIPQEVLDRFPSAKDWQTRLDDFWTRSKQAIEQAQTQAANYANSRVVYSVDQFLIYANGVPTPMFALDSTGVKIGDVLVVNTPGRKMYIGEGVYADDGTPFYVDTLGKFSLGASLTWDPDTDTLTIVGVINATSGTIGGFDIGADYIRDSGNSFGLASTVSGPQNIRFWAGSTFANRATAPIRILDDGTSFYSTITAARVLAVADGTSNTTVALSGNVATAASLSAMSVTTTFTVGQNGTSTHLFLAQNNTVDKGTYTGLTSYGFRLGLSNSTGTGTIDNAYGIYIDTVNIGTANWGLYVATTARNFMAGDLTVASIGSTTPGTGAFTTLSATGAITAATDVESTTIGSGFIVKSPDGTRWRITIDNAGALVTTSI
jgi:hypothetical protein